MKTFKERLTVDVFKMWDTVLGNSPRWGSEDSRSSLQEYIDNVGLSATIEEFEKFLMDLFGLEEDIVCGFIIHVYVRYVVSKESDMIFAIEEREHFYGGDESSEVIAFSYGTDESVFDDSWYGNLKAMY